MLNGAAVAGAVVVAVLVVVAGVTAGAVLALDAVSPSLADAEEFVIVPDTLEDDAASGLLEDPSSEQPPRARPKQIAIEKPTDVRTVFAMATVPWESESFEPAKATTYESSSRER